MVVRELREVVDRVPARVGRDGRVGVARDEAEKGGRELALHRVPAGVAPRLELLEVREAADVHLLREVAAQRLLEGLVRVEDAAWERPGARVRLEPALPEQRLEAALPHLEDGGEDGVGSRFRLGVSNRVHSPP